jgi:hypothetical protein
VLRIRDFRNVMLDKLQLLSLRVEREYVHLGLGITVGFPTFTERIRVVTGSRKPRLTAVGLPSADHSLSAKADTNFAYNRRSLGR